MDARAGSSWHKMAVVATPRNSPRALEWSGEPWYRGENLPLGRDATCLSYKGLEWRQSSWAICQSSILSWPGSRRHTAGGGLNTTN